MNLLDEASNSKFVTRNQNIANSQSNANYDAGNGIIYNKEVLKSNLCNYSNAYILVTGDISFIGNNGTQVAFKNCALFTKCITKIDRTTIDDAEDLDFAVPMYDFIECSPNYSVTIGSLGFYSKD